MSVRNLLTEEEQSLSSSTSLWTATSASTVIARSVARYNSEPASMLVSTTNGTRMEVRLDREMRIVPNKSYRLFYSAYSDVADHPFGVKGSIYSPNGNEILVVSEDETTVFGRWAIVSVQFTAPQNAQSISVKAYAEPSHTTASGETVVHTKIWMDDFVLVEWSEYPSNEFATLVQRHVPEYMLEVDDEEPGKPLRRFIDVLTSTADDVLMAVRGFDYIPAVDGVPGYDRCTLVDPSYYPDELVAKRGWLPWLAQLVGARGVSSGSSGLTPWFWLEQEIGTWTGMETQIDPQSNPVWDVDGTQMTRTGGVVTAILSTQTGGSTPYFPQVGDVVEVITSDSSFAGSFSIASSNQGALTVTWEQAGPNAPIISSSAIRVSDASWVEIESANPLAFDTVGVLADLVRTRATGLRSGSRYAIKAAARSVLDGFDDSATASSDGASSIVVTTASPHTLVVGAFVEIYDCPEAPYNRAYIVSQVLSPTSFKVDTPYGAGNDPHYGEQFPCMVTNKKVELVMTGQWTGQYKTTEAQTYAVSLLHQAVSLAKPAGLVLQHQYTA